MTEDQAASLKTASTEQLLAKREQIMDILQGLHRHPADQREARRERLLVGLHILDEELNARAEAH